MLLILDPSADEADDINATWRWAVPLSEHEQRLLEQMERALYAEDPKFASSLRQPVIRQGSRKRVALGIIIGLVGLALLVTGVAVKLPVVGVLGFVAMLVGAIISLTGGANVEAGAAAASKPAPSGKAKGSPSASGGGFMGRMEDRWKHRQEGDSE
ncbi:MAG: hypothetical protein QG597_5304 [Actinomycetota bacterium]|nr:hypothetical protein [Actinomycetota bacterium]